MKFSKTYEIGVEVRVDYVNIPRDKFIIRADTVLNFTVKANGFSLMTENLKKINRIKIDLSRYPFRKSAGGTFEYNIHINKETEKYIHGFFPFAEGFSEISPRNLSTMMQPAHGKWIPVKHNINFTPDKQHFVYGAIVVKPDSIYVTGPKNNIDRIIDIETAHIDLGIINETQYIKAALPEAHNRGFHLSQDKVDIRIPIERFTETTFEIPIEIPQTYDESNIKIFPEYAKIVVIVALKDFNELTPDMFDVSIDTGRGLTGNTLPLVVRKKPPHINISRIIPETVEFIKIQ